jgi:hypothetical protein
LSEKMHTKGRCWRNLFARRREMCCFHSRKRTWTFELSHR